MNPISLALEQEEERLRRLAGCLDAEASFEVFVARHKLEVADADDADKHVTKVMKKEISLPSDVLIESTSRTIESSRVAVSWEFNINPYLAAALRSELQSQMQLRVCLAAELASVEAGSFQALPQSHMHRTCTPAGQDYRSESVVSAESSDLDQTEASGDMVTVEMFSAPEISDAMSTCRTMWMESKPELVCSDKKELVAVTVATVDTPDIDVQVEENQTQESLSYISCDRVDKRMDIKDDVLSELVTSDEKSEVVKTNDSIAKAFEDQDSDVSEYNELSGDTRMLADDSLGIDETKGPLLASVGEDVNTTISIDESERMVLDGDCKVYDRMSVIKLSQSQLLEDDSFGDQTFDMSEEALSLSTVFVNDAVVDCGKRADLETLRDANVSEDSVSEASNTVETDNFVLTDAVSSGSSLGVTLYHDEIGITNESGTFVGAGEASSHMTTAVSREDLKHEGNSKEELPSVSSDAGVAVDNDQHELEISAEPISDGSRQMDTSKNVQISSTQPTVVVPWLMPKTLEESNKMLREERSLRMMLEQLAKITQDECNGLRALLARETTTRMKMETQAADLKVELKKSQKETEELQKRIHELEDSLQGTMILVKKLEEQSSTSLLSRGGIDYMLEAKLATNRANEAEQKNQLLQSELLQSQGEVKQLLGRLTELSHERTEMVSGKVHSELMKIADDKARAAELRAADLQSELDKLKLKLSERSFGGDTPEAKSPYDIALTGGLSYPSSFSYLPHTTSSHTTSLFSSSLSSPYSSCYPGGSSFLLEPMTTEGSKIGSGSLFSSYKSGFLDETMASTPTQHNKPPPLSPKKRKTVSFQDPPATTTLSSRNSSDLELPLLAPILSKLELTGKVEPEPPASAVTASVDKGLASKDSDSSDWSSDEDDAPSFHAGPPPVGYHADLVAQWEWRSTHSVQSEHKSQVCERKSEEKAAKSPVVAKKPVTVEHMTDMQPIQPVVVSPNKTHRPPVAPKPALKQKLRFQSSQRQNSADSMLMEQSVSFEDDPSSFERAPSLTRLFSRPKGPLNRRRPSRFYKPSSH